MSKLREAVRVRCGQHPEIDSQVKLADHLGISESQISRVLSNRRRRLTGEQIGRMASFLEISTEEMIQLLAADEREANDGRSIESVNAKIDSLGEEQSMINRQIIEILDRLDTLDFARDIKGDIQRGDHHGVET
jgi:transcriptional regulator with XRE-family HTH domain